MSEHSPEQAPPDVVEPTPLRTGVEQVDEVLDSVADLDQVPLEEHVAVFEGAHDRLRGALDGSSPS